MTAACEIEQYAKQHRCDAGCAKPGNCMDREKCTASPRVGDGKEARVDSARIRRRNASEQDRGADRAYRRPRRHGQCEAQQAPTMS